MMATTTAMIRVHSMNAIARFSAHSHVCVCAFVCVCVRGWVGGWVGGYVHPCICPYICRHACMHAGCKTAGM